MFKVFQERYTQHMQKSSRAFPPIGFKVALQRENTMCINGTLFIVFVSVVKLQSLLFMHEFDL